MEEFAIYGGIFSITCFIALWYWVRRSDNKMTVLEEFENGDIQIVRDGEDILIRFKHLIGWIYVTVEVSKNLRMYKNFRTLEIAKQFLKTNYISK